MRFHGFWRLCSRSLLSFEGTKRGYSGGERRLISRFIVWGLFLVFFAGLPALAVHDAGVMELDGNIVDDVTPGGTEIPTDWGDLFSSGSPGGTPLALPTDAFSSEFTHDEASPDPTTFTGGGSKDINDIPSWQCIPSVPTPDKDNILHTYGVSFRPTSGNKINHALVYLALERFDNAGAADVGFWLLQDPTANCTSSGSATSFTGVHQEGDLLIVAEFTNGGAVATINVYQWTGGALNTTPIASGADCASAGAADNVCGSVNTSSLTTPWADQDKTSGPNTLAISEFFELGIDITAIGAPGSCYRAVISETRSSASVSATLKDFTRNALNTCLTDLAVTKTDSPDPVIAGNNLTYTLNVTNNGPDNAGGVIVTDTLPGGVTFISAVPSQGSCSQSAGVVTCSLGIMANAASATITITVTPNTTGTITNTAQVTGDEADTNTANNTATEMTTVLGTDLSVTKIDSPDPVIVGNNVTYTVTVTNNGPGTATGVTATDTLPPGVTFVSATPSQGSCSQAAGVVTCNLGTLTNGSSATITIVITTSAAGMITNTVSVAANETDTNPNNNTATQSTTVNPSANLSIVKSDSPDQVNAGGTLTYTLQINNAGPSPATSVTVTDVLPAGVTFISAIGSGWSCSESAGTVTCTRASLAVGPAPDITITVTAPSNDGIITNNASVSSPTNDPNTGNNTDTETTTVNPVADLSIVKSDNPDPVNANSTLTYTLNVSNAGPNTATNVTVTDTLPTGTTFVSASGTGWSCSEAAGTVTCTRTSLVVGAAPAITITVTAPSNNGTITDTATVTSSTTDSNLNNNTDTEDTTVNAVADLSIVKSDNPDPVNAGATLAYTLQVTNAGPSTATNVTVTDTLPTGTTFVSASGTGWSCGQASGIVTCTRTSLAVGAAPNITITVTAPSSGGTITDIASVNSSTTDSNPNNNTDTEDTTVNPVADLSITKSDNPDPVSANGTLTYTLNVANAGPSTATNVTVTDTLPGGTTFVSATGSGWGCGQAAGIVTCTRASLAVGAAPAITIIVTAPANGGTITDTATVSSSTTDLNPSNNTDTEDTTVTSIADLAINKSDNPDPVNAGATLTYTLQVTNNGPSTATSVTVTDTLPAGVTFVSASGAGWNCGQAAGVVTCTMASLPVGAASPITITVAAPSEGGTITDTASVSSQTVDSNPNNNTDTEDTTVISVADLSIVKSDNPDPVNAGATLTYTLQVTNNGPSTAATVSVSDTLPAGVTFVSASGSGWSCSQAVGIVTCTRTSLAVGTASPITITVTAPNEAGTLIDTATVTSASTDPNPANNTDTEDTTVNPVSDLSIVKSDNPDPVNATGTLTYTLQVTNLGPSTATNVMVIDTLPGSVTFVSASGTGWSCSQAAGTVTCTLGSSLSVGAAAPITIVVTAPANATTLTNTATVTSTTPDSNQGNNTDTEDTTVNPVADLQIVKTHSGNFIAGQNSTYNITITNNGPSTAAGPITVIDTLPIGLTFVSASGAGWTCSAFGQTVTCMNPSSLPVGASSTFTITVSVDTPATSNIKNVATVSSSTPDPNPQDNTDDDLVTVVCNSTGDIHGVKYLDFDGDGNQDRNEPFLSNITITLTGTDWMGNPVSLMTTTDGNGKYSFQGLPPGTYTVCEVLPPGFHQTFPRMGPQCSSGGLGHQIMLACGQTVFAKFANTRDTEPFDKLAVFSVQTMMVQHGIHFLVAGHGVKDLQVQIVDLKGRSIYQSDWNPNGWAWLLENKTGQRVANGVYLYTVTVRGEDGKLIQTKLQKFVIKWSKAESELTKPFAATAVHTVLASNVIYFLVAGHGVLKDLQIEVFDLRGKSVYLSNRQPNGFAWHLEDRHGTRLVSGVYLYVVTVRGQNGEVVKTQLQKLIVK
ncbi:DUF11 domain-containing protein [Candidatus Acetothermia bacterium]|nr:DUF11 domain-containing protein [Candidatus Acetothermia bacterium]